MDDEDNLEEQVNPVDVEVEEPTEEIVEEDAAPEEDNFYKNLAEDMDDRALTLKW